MAVDVSLKNLVKKIVGVYVSVIKAYVKVALPLVMLLSIAVPLIIGVLSNIQINLPIANTKFTVNGTLVNETAIKGVGLVVPEFNETTGKLEGFKINVPTVFGNWVMAFINLLPLALNIIVVLVVLAAFALKKATAGRVKKVEKIVDEISGIIESFAAGLYNLVSYVFKANLMIVTAFLIALGMNVPYVQQLFGPLFGIFGWAVAGPIALISIVASVLQVILVMRIVKVFM